MGRIGLRRGLLTAAAVTLVGAGALASCGDDDGGDDVEAYCDLVNDVNNQEEIPSDEQLDDIEAVAPDEISEDIEFVAERLREDGEAAFQDPEFTERFAPIEEFETENCDTGDAS